MSNVVRKKILSAFFRQEAADLLKQEVRGFGYWIWKPQILLQCLQQMEYGDILLYTDAGCHINEVGKNMFLAYIKEVKKSSFGIFGIWQLAKGFIRETIYKR